MKKIRAFLSLIFLGIQPGEVLAEGDDGGHGAVREVDERETRPQPGDEPAVEGASAAGVTPLCREGEALPQLHAEVVDRHDAGMLELSLNPGGRA